MNVTFGIVEATCCPKLNSFVNEIASNGSDVAIVSIICVTILISLLTIVVKLFGYLNKRLSSEDDKKTIESLSNQKAALEGEIDRIKKEKENVEKKTQLTFDQKEKNRFLDFCYEMAKSKAMADQTIKNECWDILKDRYPIETQKENEN